MKVQSINRIFECIFILLRKMTAKVSYSTYQNKNHSKVVVIVLSQNLRRRRHISVQNIFYKIFISFDKIERWNCFKNILSVFDNSNIFPINILIFNMIDQNQVQQELYFFQIIPLKLLIITKESQNPTQGSSYRLSIFKGHHRFDESKVPLSSPQYSFKDLLGIDISSYKLSFYLPNSKKALSQEFNLILIQNQKNQDFKVGECCIDAGAIAAEFKDHHQYFYQFTTNLSEKYQLTFYILVEKTLAALEQKAKYLKEKQFNKIFIKTPKNDALSTKQNQSDPIIIERSEKNMVSSQASYGKRVPFIEVRYKAITKKDAPSELTIANSIKVPSNGMTTNVPAQLQEKVGQNGGLTLWIALVASLILIYFVMHPSSKV